MILLVIYWLCLLLLIYYTLKSIITGVTTYERVKKKFINLNTTISESDLFTSGNEDTQSRDKYSEYLL